MGCGPPLEFCTGPESDNGPALGKDSESLELPFSVGKLNWESPSVAHIDTYILVHIFYSNHKAASFSPREVRFLSFR